MFLTVLNVEKSTGGLFQLPSVGIASNVFPRFQPGFEPVTHADAVMGCQVSVHVLALLTTGAAALPTARAASPRTEPIIAIVG